MNISQKISSLLTGVLDIIFPMQCNLCGNNIETEGMCQVCWKKINWISDPRCEICGAPFTVLLNNICAICLEKKPHFDKAISVFEYDDFSKNIIIKFKHYDSTHLTKYISSLMYLASKPYVDEAHIIVPIPIHLSRRLKRKYNQSELIAMEISRASGLPYEPRILKKHKKTLSQEELSAQKRKTNVKGSFSINKFYKDMIKDKEIILVDDVFTTGSTVNECSKILKKNGVKKVTVITLSKVVLANR